MQLVHTHCDCFNSSCTISFKKGNFFVEKNQYWSQKLIQKSLVPLGLSKSNMYLTKQIICVNYNRKYQLQKFQETDMSSFLLHTDLPEAKIYTLYTFAHCYQISLSALLSFLFLTIHMKQTHYYDLLLITTQLWKWETYICPEKKK